jgi:hypothetical protein
MLTQSSSLQVWNHELRDSDILFLQWFFFHARGIDNAVAVHCAVSLGVVLRFGVDDLQNRCAKCKPSTECAESQLLPGSSQRHTLSQGKWDAGRGGVAQMADVAEDRDRTLPGNRIENPLVCLVGHDQGQFVGRDL